MKENYINIIQIDFRTSKMYYLLERGLHFSFNRLEKFDGNLQHCSYSPS
jgi:hypothetical protein